MSLRFPLAAAAALVGFAVLAAPAFSMETIHIPDSSTPNNGLPPDGLFDSSVPDTWQKKSGVTDSQSGQGMSVGGFHFSASSGTYNTQLQPSSTANYGGALVPGSEFSQPLPGYDPYLPH
jgi:hypothetical protein